MSEMLWWDWFREHAGGGNNRAMAARAGVDPSNLTRWAKGAGPDAGTAISVGRSLERSPVEALVAAGYLTSTEAQLREVPASLERQDDADLLLELLRRHRNRLAHGRFDRFDKSALAVVAAWDSAEKIMALPGNPLFVSDAELVAEGEAEPGLYAARRGKSRGEAARQAQDDDADA